MAGKILTAVLAISLYLMTGCFETAKKPHLTAAPPESPTQAEVRENHNFEAELIEDMIAKRNAYYQALEQLKAYYKKTGNHMKLDWAEKELNAIKSMPRYRYIIEAEVAGPKLKATDSIEQADELYAQALENYNKAKALLLITDDSRLRLALGEFNQLIKTYPSSDKIDDAAFKSGQIYEHFKDYEIALLYYKRTFQWDDETPYPVRSKAAYILDKKLHRRDQALELYRLSIEREGSFYNYARFARERIKHLTSPDKTGRKTKTSTPEK